MINRNLWTPQETALLTRIVFPTGIRGTVHKANAVKASAQLGRTVRSCINQAYAVIKLAKATPVVPPVEPTESNTSMPDVTPEQLAVVVTNELHEVRFAIERVELKGGYLSVFFNPTTGVAA